MNKGNFFTKGEKLTLLFFVILKIIIQFTLVHPSYDLHRDEFLHLDQGLHPAAGYISLPPLTGYISMLIQAFGSPEWLVRFIPALFGALTLFLTGLTVKELGGGLYALVLACTAFLFSLILRLNILYQPNSLDILCWTALLYFLIRYFGREEKSCLLWAGLVLGLGILNKYNILFLVAGLLPSLLLTKERKIFKEKTFYFGTAITIILIFPNLLWQIKNDFPVVSHMKELSSSQLKNVDRGEFLFHQVLYFLGSFWLIILALIGFLISPQLRELRFLFYTYLFTIGLFLFFRGKDYYAIGIYPVYLATGAFLFERWIRQKRKLQWLKPVTIVVIVLVSLPPTYAVYPLLSAPELYGKRESIRGLGVLKWEDGKEHHLPQDFADMRGWKELALKVQLAYRGHPEKQNLLVLCNNYGQAGAINYYAPGLNAVSFNADYINWFPLEKPVLGLIRVKTEGDPISDEEQSLFSTIRLLSVIEDSFAREKGTRVYLMEGEKDLRNILHQKILNKED